MDEINENARRLHHLAMFALTVLLDRYGGNLTLTQSEYEAVVAKHGGPVMMALHLEYVTLGSGEQAVRAVLVRKQPQQGELPS